MISYTTPLAEIIDKDYFKSSKGLVTVKVFAVSGFK